MRRLVSVRYPCNRKKYWEYFILLNLMCGSLFYFAFYNSSTANSSATKYEITSIRADYRSNLFLNLSNTLRIKRGDSSRPIILFWTPYFDTYEFSAFGIDEESLRNCQFQCSFTFDKSLISNSSAVIFHIRDLSKVDLPLYHSHTQVWIFYLLESGSNTRLDLNPYAHVFNWTMTYRRDSDIHHPYARIIPKQPTLQRPEPRNGHSDDFKSRLLVAWVVSNCFTYSNRESFVSELSKHIRVDIYGSCGDRSCPGDTSSDCYAHIAKSYMFYLAFENLLCTDYVTEKFYDSLNHGMVPVVYGRANYSAFAPPHSFIDTRDYGTPQLLAKYLLYLSANPLEYQKYFRWKEAFQVVPSEGWCNLCAKLRTDKVTKTYASISKWWDEAPSSLNPQSGVSIIDHGPTCLPVPYYPNESWWNVFRKKYFILP